MEIAESRRRALAALRALAVGDAMGAATEGYQPDEVEQIYDAPVNELIEPVNLYPESVPDREQGVTGPVTACALAAARRLAGGPVEALDGDVLAWAVPLGLVSPVGQPEELIRWAGEFASGGARAAGAAAAAAIAAGMAGYLVRDALGQAVRTATAAGDPRLASRLVAAAGSGQSSGGRQVGQIIGAEFPPGPHPADVVVFAFGVAFGTQSVRRAIPAAVNQGGPASLTGALAGALCAVISPASSVEAWGDEVERASGLDLASVADALLTARGARNGAD